MPSQLEHLQKCSKGNVPLEVLDRNKLSALKRNLPTLFYGKPIEGKVAVVAGGPSVKDSLEELRNFDGYLIAINGTHNWLIENDIVPDACIIVDAKPTVTDLFKNPHKDTTYLVASNCDPSLFDALEDYKVILWHVAKEEESKGSIAIVAGPSAVTAAPTLLYVRGDRDVHFYGADSSLSAVDSHVYSSGNVGTVGKERLQVLVGGEVYMSTGAFVLQATSLWELNEVLKDVKMTIHGYGLAKAIFDNNGEFEII